MLRAVRGLRVRERGGVAGREGQRDAVGELVAGGCVRGVGDVRVDGARARVGGDERGDAAIVRVSRDEGLRAGRFAQDVRAGFQSSARGDEWNEWNERRCGDDAEWRGRQAGETIRRAHQRVRVHAAERPRRGDTGRGEDGAREARATGDGCGYQHRRRTFSRIALVARGSCAHVHLRAVHRRAWRRRGDGYEREFALAPRLGKERG